MQFAEADGLNCMMRLLSSASVTVQEEVVGLIRNACVGYHGNKNQLTFCGAFWSFAQMLNQPSLADSVREEIVSAVHYGTVGHEVNKQAAGEAQGNATSGSEDEYAPLIEGVTCTAPVLFCLVLAFCTTLSLL